MQKPDEQVLHTLRLDSDPPAAARCNSLAADYSSLFPGFFGHLLKSQTKTRAEHMMAAPFPLREISVQLRGFRLVFSYMYPPF